MLLFIFVCILYAYTLPLAERSAGVFVVPCRDIIFVMKIILLIDGENFKNYIKYSVDEIMRTLS